jgi:hypothetical protein
MEELDPTQQRGSKPYEGEERRHAQKEYEGEDRRQSHAAANDDLEQENEQLQQQDHQHGRLDQRGDKPN